MVAGVRRIGAIKHNRSQRCKPIDMAASAGTAYGMSRRVQDGWVMGGADGRWALGGGRYNDLERWMSARE